jgi:cytochrome c
MRSAAPIVAGLFAFAGMLAIAAATPVFSQPPTTAAAAPQGRQLFEKRCTGCHSLDTDKEGPRLRWLTSTESVVRDNNMDFSVPKPEERAAIIQYLRESSGK